MNGQSWKSGVIALLAAVMLPIVASAQGVAVADAQAFIGSWSLTLDTPQGAMPMDVNVKDADGKVAGEIGSDMMGVVAVTDISKSGESLVLRHTFDMQGNAVPIQITLIPDGANMKFALDAAGGQFYVEGPATKK